MDVDQADDAADAEKNSASVGESKNNLQNCSWLGYCWYSPFKDRIVDDCDIVDSIWDDAFMSIVILSIVDDMHYRIVVEIW